MKYGGGNGGGEVLIRRPMFYRSLSTPLSASTTHFKDLSVDLTAKILCRLPVKSIVRSTAVDSCWNLLFSKPPFVAEQLSHALRNGDKYLLLMPSSFSKSNSLSLISEKTHTEQIIQIPFRAKSGFLSSILGLICIGDARDFYLWNPSVYMYIRIHSSCYRNMLNDTRNTYSVIGLGYNDLNDDFRIVRVLFGSGLNINPRVEIYSLISNSWRKLECDVPRVLDQEACVSAGAGGFVYWLELKKDNSVEWIVSFDFDNNIFEEFMLPRNLRRSRPEKVSLLNFKGSVSVCCTYAADAVQKKYSAWVLRRENINGGSVSWTEQFRTVSKVVGSPMMFTSCGKLVLQTLNNLTLFDPEKKKFMLIGSNGPYTGGPNSFMETLALFAEHDPKVTLEFFDNGKHFFIKKRH